MLGLGLGLGIGGGGGISGPAPPPGFGAAGGLWLRADRGIATGGTIASWPDQSGNGNTFAQASGPRMPTCTAGAGPKVTLPAVVFSGAGTQFMTLASAIIPTKNFTVAMVFKATSVAVQQAVFATGNASNGWALGVDLAADNNRSLNANGVIGATAGAATTAWEAWIFSSDASGNLTMRVNGANQAVSPGTATAGAPTALTVLGSLAGTSRFLDGSLFEVLVYPTMLSSNTSLLAYQSAETGLF